MCEWLLGVTLLALLLTSNCLYAGDSCVVDDDKAGSCKPLSECPPLVSEIRRAGAPMPSRLRVKLQKLACGFRSDEPMVCCVTPFTNSNPDTDPNQPWIQPVTGIHGMGGGNNFGTPEPTWTQPDQGSSQDNWNEATNQPGRGNGGSNPNDRPVNDRPLTNNPSNSADIERHRNLRLLPDSGTCGILESDRIWGGNRTRLYEMPWMVLVKYDSPRGVKLSCGGTLISERYVLTAAHCLTFLGNRLTLSGIILGEYDVRQDPDCERVEGERHCAPKIRTVSIEKIVAHPGYSPQSLYDDIALVRLSEAADFTLDSMKPICLPTTAELLSEPLVGNNGIVAGWGATEDGLQSPVLLSVDLPIIDNKECQDAYNGNPQIHDSQICAGGVQDKDSCGGDSGGPLLYPGRIRAGAIRYVQRGIVSYGSKRCGVGGFPGVYTRVSHYMNWILDNMESYVPGTSKDSQCFLEDLPSRPSFKDAEVQTEGTMTRCAVPTCGQDGPPGARPHSRHHRPSTFETEPNGIIDNFTEFVVGFSKLLKNWTMKKISTINNTPYYYTTLRSILLWVTIIALIRIPIGIYNRTRAEHYPRKKKFGIPPEIK